MTKATENGYPGTFKMLSPGSIHVDPKYQRGEHFKHSQRIANEFDWHHFGVAIVSRRAGAYFAIDGQHRTVAAGIAGMEKVPCIVFHNLKVKDEAASWKKVNVVRVNPTPIQVWHCSLAEEEPDTLATQVILARYAFKVSPQKFKEGSPHVYVRCPSLLIKLYQVGELEEILKILTECWPRDPHIVRSLYIQGLKRFLEIYNARENRLPRASMIKRLSALSATEISNRARAFIQYSHSDSYLVAVRNVLLQCYNTGLKPMSKLVA